MLVSVVLGELQADALERLPSTIRTGTVSKPASMAARWRRCPSRTTKPVSVGYTSMSFQDTKSSDRLHELRAGAQNQRECCSACRSVGSIGHRWPGWTAPIGSPPPRPTTRQCPSKARPQVLRGAASGRPPARHQPGPVTRAYWCRLTHDANPVSSRRRSRARRSVRAGWWPVRRASSAAQLDMTVISDGRASSPATHEPAHHQQAITKDSVICLTL